jgi:hypothetical protein
MIFACVNTSLRRQFEFVQEEWVNSGIFIGHSQERDPCAEPTATTASSRSPNDPSDAASSACPASS